MMHPIIEALEVETKRAVARWKKQGMKNLPALSRAMVARHKAIGKISDFNGTAQLKFEARTWQADTLGLQSVEIPAIISKVTNYKVTQFDAKDSAKDLKYPALYNHHTDQYEETWTGDIKRYLGRNVIHPLFLWKKKTTIEVQLVPISHFGFADWMTDEMGERFRLLEQSKLFNTFSVLHSACLPRDVDKLPTILLAETLTIRKKESGGWSGAPRKLYYVGAAKDQPC